jgi:hypothetical protein
MILAKVIVASRFPSLPSFPAVAMAPAEATITMSDTDTEAASVTERVAHPAPVVAKATDASIEATDDGNVAAAADEVAVTIPGIDEPPSLHALVAAAASEPAQGSDWWLPILGFKCEVVQDCYDANQGDTRLRGCWIASALAALAFIHRVISRVSAPRLRVPEWVQLLTLCMPGLIAAILFIALCIISDGNFNKRHTLQKVAQGAGFMAVVGTLTESLSFFESSVHASSVSSWEETIFVGFHPGWDST